MLSYRFQVYANDNGQPIALTATTTIEVTIVDVNDNTPMFVGLDRDNCYHFRIAENQPPNTYVGMLKRFDIYMLIWLVFCFSKLIFDGMVSLTPYPTVFLYPNLKPIVAPEWLQDEFICNSYLKELL